MKLFFLRHFFFYCLVCIKVHAKITQTSCILPILVKIKKANSEFLIIFDLIDTLVMYEYEIFHSNNKKLLNSCLTELNEEEQENNNSKILYDRHTIFSIYKQQNFKINDEYKEIIEYIQSNELPAITIVNNIRIADCLKKHNISIKSIAIEARTVKYINGLNYIKNNKEIDFCLQKIIKFGKYKTVIVISANKKFIERIENFCNQNNVECEGYEYTFVKTAPVMNKKNMKEKLKILFQQKARKKI